MVTVTRPGDNEFFRSSGRGLEVAEKLGVRRSRLWEAGVDLAAAGEDGNGGGDLGRKFRCWRRSGVTTGRGSSMS
jgi:hypothetical protein